MSEILKKTKLATAVKNISLCAAGTALLASAGAANALDVKVGGYVKTDLTYDLDQDLGASVGASSVTTGSGVDSNESLRMHSLQSRINFSATEGDLKVFAEGDFFTSDSSELVSNSRHFRIRHAFGKMGNLLIGQTWSAFMDANWVLYPSTIDFAGPAGATFVRQSQIRWTIADGLDLSFENPENRVAQSGTRSVVGIVAGAPAVVTESTSTNVGRDTLPDVILRYASKGDVSWQVAGLFQQFEVDGGAADGESESNFGLTGGVAVNFGGGSFSIKANSNSNRYTYYGFANPAAIVSGDKIELIDHTAVVAALNLDWGGASKAKTTIALGTVTFDDEFLGASSAEEVSTVHINYRWSPYNNVNLGLELIQASREDVNGDDGDAARVQFGAQYVF